MVILQRRMVKKGVIWSKFWGDALMEFRNYSILDIYKHSSRKIGVFFDILSVHPLTASGIAMHDEMINVLDTYVRTGIFDPKHLDLVTRKIYLSKVQKYFNIVSLK